MTIIAYTHSSHFRGLTKADIEKYMDKDEDVDLSGLKFTKHPNDSSDTSRQLWFRKGVPVEVPDEVADVLLNHEHFADEFTEIETDDQDPEDEEVVEAANKAAKKTAKKAAKQSAGAPTEGDGVHTQGSADTGGTAGTAAATSTGAGSSTTGD